MAAHSPTYRTIAVFILLLAATSYLVRIVVPINRYVLFFPTISYLPEYVSFFLIGTEAYRGDWLRKVSSSVAKRVFAICEECRREKNQFLNSCKDCDVIADQSIMLFTCGPHFIYKWLEEKLASTTPPLYN